MAVAVITVCGVLFQVIVSYFISRQDANDLHANIDREISIIRKLRPGSPEVKRLEAHLSASISQMIERDECRARTVDLIRSFGPLPVIYLIIWALDTWRSHGVPEGLRGMVSGTLYGLIAVWIFLSILFLWQTGRFLFELLRLAVLYVRKSTRITVLRVRGWYTARQLANIKLKHQIVQEHVKTLMDWLNSNRDNIIAENGQQCWDDLMKSRQEYETQIAELDRLHDKGAVDN